MKTRFSTEQGATRRLFLKGALGAAAAPLILPSRVLGRERQLAPSNRLTFGLIGCGGMGVADAIHIHQRMEPGRRHVGQARTGHASAGVERNSGAGLFARECAKS